MWPAEPKLLSLHGFVLARHCVCTLCCDLFLPWERGARVQLLPRAAGWTPCAQAELLELEWLLNREMFPWLSPSTGGALQRWLAAWCTPCCWASGPWGKRLWKHSITDMPSSYLQMTSLRQAANQGGCRRQWWLLVFPAPRSTRVRWENDGEGSCSSTQTPHCLSPPGTAAALP